MRKVIKVLRLVVKLMVWVLLFECMRLKFVSVKRNMVKVLVLGLRNLLYMLIMKVFGSVSVSMCGVRLGE